MNRVLRRDSGREGRKERRWSESDGKDDKEES